MIETFAALLAAHVMADFVLQPGWMVRRKRTPAVILLHAGVVLATAQAATGQVATPELLLLAAAHLVIDAIKLAAKPGLAAFLADQAAHLATLAALAAWSPGLWQAGIWAATPFTTPLLHALILGAGAVVATRAGGFAVGLLMAPYTAVGQPEALKGKGLQDGGLTIGLLERGLIFVLFLAGQADAIGFLIAAKSVLRFGTITRDRAASEYVIIGTLASFGWAIAVTLATLALRDLLPPLELLPPSP